MLTFGLWGQGSVTGSGTVHAASRTSRPLRAYSAASASAVRARYDRLPLTFEAGADRRVGGVRFLARGSGYGVYLADREVVLALGAPMGPSARSSGNDHGSASAILRFHLLGGNPHPTLAPGARQQGTVTYFSGVNPRTWRRGLPTYGQVLYTGVYPGVNLRFYGTQGRLEYDFHLASHVSANRIRQSVTGVRSLRLAPNGDLLLITSGGSVRWARPVAYQTTRAGRRIRVQAQFRLLNAATFGFALGHYDTDTPLVIDPVLTYSTFYGNNSVATGIALDPSGAAYIAGYTYQAIITTTNAFQQGRVACPTCADAFVAKISADGQHLVYGTYLGGGGNNVATTIAVDRHGSAYVAGYTNSGLGPTMPDFPVSPHAYQRTNHGGNDAFIVKLSPNGQSLVYSTYLGGSTDNANTVGDDIATGIAIDTHGDAFVTGNTFSYNLPLKYPLQGSLGYGRGTLGSQEDAFVTKLNPSGSNLVYSTYLGGSLTDTASGIAVDRAGNAYVVGQTNSPDFPTPAHALQGKLYGTDFNAFVAKLSASGRSLVYATYLGQTAADKIHGVAVDSASNAYIVGETNGGMPRTVGVPQPVSGGGLDAFVAKLSPRGVLTYSTYLGGVGDDVGAAIALDPVGNAYVTGSTASATFTTPVFPLKRALQKTLGGNRGGFGMLDAFVAKVNSCGSAILYSSYLGGTFVDSGDGIAVDAHGNAYVAGQTLSPNFPIKRPLPGGDVYVPPTANAFVAKISGSPASPSSACPLPLTVDAAPTIKSVGPFTVTVHTAPGATVTVNLEIRNAIPPATSKQPKLHALLYRKTIRGRADAYGLYQGVLRLKFVTAVPVLATVHVKAVRGRAAVVTNTSVQLTP